jgi:quercetin dioxygenase-like cupin family protein
MEYIKAGQFRIFYNPGFSSEQLLFPENSKSERVTITRVTVEPGGVNQRHVHAVSEQIWIALRGQGSLLLAGNKELAFTAGDVVRFQDGEEHGLQNGTNEAFIYLSVTSPPTSFRSSYMNDHKLEG